MKVNYALVSHCGVISLWYDKRRIPYTKLEEILVTNTAHDGMDVSQAQEYKRICDGLLQLNLVLFASEFTSELGNLRRPIKASAIRGSYRYELDLRTMDQTITPLK